MTNGFDPMAVWVKNERGEVIRVVLRAKSRRTFIAPAGRKGSPMECFDGSAVGRPETDV